jgi:hypothetical protein
VSRLGVIPLPGTRTVHNVGGVVALWPRPVEGSSNLAQRWKKHDLTHSTTASPYPSMVLLTSPAISHACISQAVSTSSMPAPSFSIPVTPMGTTPASPSEEVAAELQR